MTSKNAPPAHIWEALRRLRACNKLELAEALGVHRHTLKRWEAATEAGTSPGHQAEAAARLLLLDTLAAAKIAHPI